MLDALLLLQFVKNHFLAVLQVRRCVVECEKGSGLFESQQRATRVSSKFA